MKLVFERFDNDPWIKDIERRYLDPPEYDDIPTFYIHIDVDTYDEKTGDTQNIVIDNYEISNEFIEDEKQAVKWVEDNLEHIIVDEMENDERFSDYEDFENVNIIINDIYVNDSEGFTESLTEANGNLKQQVELYLDTLLDSNVEYGLVQTLYGKVNGYDPDWASDSTTNEYKKARNEFIAQTMKLLFANFNK